MTIGIVGLGYVGLPLAVAFAKAGERVIGVDTSVAKVASIRRGESYIEDIPSDELQAVRSRLEATTRAYARIIDEVNKLPLATFQRPEEK